MNEQRRDFFKNSALGLATITLGAGLSLVPSAQAEEKPSNTATTAICGGRTPFFPAGRTTAQL